MLPALLVVLRDDSFDGRAPFPYETNGMKPRVLPARPGIS
jgi:hypothetical protein